MAHAGKIVVSLCRVALENELPGHKCWSLTVRVLTEKEVMAC